MNHPVALDAALATGTPDTKDESRLLPMWSVIIVVGVGEVLRIELLTRFWPRRTEPLIVLQQLDVA